MKEKWVMRDMFDFEPLKRIGERQTVYERVLLLKGKYPALDIAWRNVLTILRMVEAQEAAENDGRGDIQ